MTLEALMDTVPSYAKDLKLNFSSLVMQQTELTAQQNWGRLSPRRLPARTSR